ncbi:hypothetical protein EZV62_007122 [Acer yangbiense]|uniref:F-box domain-containing protein n=1 Tax=Acer yangbiense TaxID=1000413 RepID=A0A5C7I9K6_9ROSI|nr:hypothetical protein EZV62_007122 [Acer yangbiense]
MRSVFIIDQIRFRAVCKRLRSSIYSHIKFADKLPWIMGYSEDKDIRNKDIRSSLFYLYEPSQKRRYRLDNEILVGAELHASKFGWLLLSRKTKSSTFPHSFFFYCPFTGEIIQLPELDMGDANRATFSTAPTSTDCVIFVISIHLPYRTDIDYKFCVSTCSPGDTTWRSNLRLGENYGGPLFSVAYANGVFYCAFHAYLMMGAYNHALQEWKLHPYPPVFKRPTYYFLYLIESPDDGNVILLSKHYTGPAEYCVNVFRFDQSQMKWYRIENFSSGYSESHDRDDEQTVEIKNLNKRMLFYSDLNGLSLAAEGEASELANTIHEASMLKIRCLQLFAYCNFASKLEEAPPLRARNYRRRLTDHSIHIYHRNNMSNLSDLPVEIINFIAERLYYTDQIRFRAVCKRLRSSIYNHIKFADKLPWIMGYSENKYIRSSLFYLYEPSQKRRYRLDNEILVGAELHASKFGWLLLSRKTKSSTSLHSFFFYCPFTGEIIQLPELDMGDANRATFSTPPTSSNCVIFVISIHLLYLKDIDYKFCVSTCSPGDTTWRSNLRLGETYGGLMFNAAYVNGVFYCAFHAYQMMGAYNHALQEWKVHPYPPVFKRRTYYFLYLIESPDDRSVILLSKHKTGPAEYCVNVFRFDQSQMKWYRIENFTSGYSKGHDRDDEQTVEIENLNKRMLFYCDHNGMSLAAEGEASELANTTHGNYGGDNVKWYSEIQATFSTAPSSSDCVVFVLNSCSNPNMIRVSTCSPGDMAWSYVLFNDDYEWQIKKVTYTKGVFYCAFLLSSRFTYMGAYNPALQEWEFHPYPSFIIQGLNNHQNSDLDLIDSPDDENLLLSYYPSGECSPVYVFRFDQSQKKWFRIKNFMSVSSSCNEDHHERVEIETLNNRVLFCSSVLKSISVPAEGEASRFANTIHWCSSEGSGRVESCPKFTSGSISNLIENGPKFGFNLLMPTNI